MNIDLLKNEKIDQLYSNNVKIIQSTEVFSFSLDAVLLADFTKVSSKRIKKIVDLCAGNGAVGLFLSQKTAAQITEIEIQPRLADMANRSIKLNGLENQFNVINDDLSKSLDYIKKDSVDVITCNPPYFLNYDTSKKNDNEYMAIARHEIKTNLDKIMMISSSMLKTNGKMYVVFRPDRLSDLLINMRKYHLEPKQIKFVYPQQGKNANMVLVEAIKDGKMNGLKILPEIVVYDNGSYTDYVNGLIYGE
ncbi:tRNA1(Val) (adenine(37)-N6)-methyltransferase [Lentilactobacillus laojiaonis]|uniref:tRNA1(Val) (adenine(37)-N6)-methyltransferase n=1 Tax=Lentilactobacillus laojiaonis TaxID=2883998 RepID=UPI001D09A395|nr:tRNA1(Val) (adenine(37)-N6)-methyltransferase [Lentilactobacillus laojiaonis]UDM31668.1 tRNA1(Val) (adenine(37)-N6)-methyltransferase [Lentilactobacillus laojiaonis]